MHFEARLFDPVRREVRLQPVQAADAVEAREQLVQAGLTLLALKVVRQAHPASAGRRDLAIWCRELRALLQAGLSVVEALDALSAASPAESVHQALLYGLREGKSLSSALQEVGGFPPLLVASVRASERTSDLPHALEAYLRFDDMMDGLRRKVVSAALYPALVVGLGGLIAIFLLWVVIPRFAALYGETYAGVSGATQVLLAFSALMAQQPWLVPLMLLVLAGASFLVSRRGRPRRAAEWLVRVWPWLGRQFANFERARQFEALALLVHGGYSLHEALGVCQSLAQGPGGQGRLAEAQQRIERGASVSSAFREAGLTEAVTERLIRAGERGGDFDRVLSAIAERHRQAFETFVERATRIVEPVLLLGVALLVGGMVVLLYMPVFDIAASVR